MKNAPRGALEAAPVSTDDGSRRLVMAVLLTTTAIACLLAAVGINPLEMLVLSGVSAACLALAAFGILLPARIAVPLAGLAVFGLLIFRNAGLRDMAILGLPAVIAGAGLVIGRWGTLAYGGASLILVAVLGALELTGRHAAPFGVPNNWIDYLAAELGIALITVLQWLVIGRLNASIRRARESEQEQRAAYDDLREATAAVHALLGALPDSIFRLDRDGVCRGFFPARDFAQLVPETDFVGRPVEEVLPPDLAHQVTQAVGRALDEGGVQTLTCPLVADGRRTDFEARVAVVDRDSAIAVVRDVTDRERAASERERFIGELAAKNAELERFTYTVSHDLKAPLITIHAFSGLLAQDAASGDAARLRADTERITRACEHMRRLLDDLLELSRIGRVVTPPSDVPLAEVAREAIELLAGRIAARGVRVTVAEGLPVVRGDRVRLLEIVQNLLDNAVKFMADQACPAIDIGTLPPASGGLATIFVRDNGRGIAPEFHERVFGLFTKLDPHSEGTGVGLALVRRIVEVHGGRAWVASAGAGRGSTFFFTLPLAGAGAGR